MRKIIILLILITTSLFAEEIKTFYLGKKIYDYKHNDIITLVGCNDLIGFRIGGAFFVSKKFRETINNPDGKSFEWYVYGGQSGSYSTPEKSIKAHANYDQDTDLLKISFELPDFWDLGLSNLTGKVPDWYKNGSIDYYIIEIEKSTLKEVL